jgi:hypothetical protein
MKKLLKFVSYVAFATLSGSVFAQTGISNFPLETVISNTDARLASAMDSAMEQYQAVTLPSPSISRAGSFQVQLIDITDTCTYGGEVISLYPSIYKMINSEENSRIIRVFSFTDLKGTKRRIEVFFTGGDWMQYGLTYVATNAGQITDQVNAYFIRDLSTPDHENGEIAPRIDPFDFPKLIKFLSIDFLNADGNVKTVFNSIATAPASVK